jgi:NTP pyrophosphatase (non-canonical NTP hydrolase)
MLSKIKIGSHSAPIPNKRQYHVYDLGAKFLSISQDELSKRKQFLKAHKDTLINKQTTISSFIKKTRTAPHFQQLEEVEKSLDACINLRRLCNEAYELGRRVREENLEELDEEYSDYLYDFICLTNEYYPCYQKEDLVKIKKMFENNSF